MTTINNNVGMGNSVNFKRNDKKGVVADNKPSDDKKMKTSTKYMIGATVLAAAVATGIVLLKKGRAPKTEKISNITENVTQEVRKSVHDMSEEELAKWSETKAKHFEKYFGKKRDLNNWHTVQEDGKPPIYRYRANDPLVSDCDDGYLFVERIGLNDKLLIKAYTEDGQLDTVLYGSSNKYIKVLRKQGGGYIAHYVDHTAYAHKNPEVILDITKTAEGLKYETSLKHDVRSEQYFPKIYRNINGPQVEEKK